MVIKAEQERIKALLRDTITLMCRNGLTFKSEFSIEALIGITLDKDDVVLVSINELVRQEKDLYRDTVPSSEEEESVDWSRHGPPNPFEGFSPRSRSGGDRNHHRRRRRKRPYIKAEVDLSTEDRHDDGLLDLSTEQPSTSQVDPPPVKRSNLQVDDMDDTSSRRHEEAEDDSKESVIVKKEYTDESWPPAGVVQEVTVGGSDSANSDQPAYPTYSTPSSLTSSTSGLLQSMAGLNAASSLISPGSSPRNPHLPPLSMMNGMPFPPLPLPQSHFAQALGRLVGSIPPNLSQKMHQVSPKESTPTKATSSPGGAALYQPTSRSSLPKEAVALMTEWLRKNMHNPYPTDDIKDDFVHKTGLSFNQINYWFTNARRRLLPKWEMQRNMREQEMVHQLTQQMGAQSTNQSQPNS